MTMFHRCGEALGIPWFRLYLADSLAGDDWAADSVGAGDSGNLRWLILHLAVQAGNGHIRTDLHAVGKDMTEWYFQPDDVKIPGFDASLPERLEKELAPLVSRGLESGLIGSLAEEESPADSLPLPRPPLVLSADGRYLYFLRRRREEDSLIAALKSRILPSSGNRFPLPGEIPDDPSGALMGRLAEGRRLLILCGGPGTGKTTTVADLLHLVARGRRESGIPPAAVVLAAPTGRAASRMTVGPLAGRTLHGLLGITPHRPPKHNSDNPLDAELVVVDEASMVDLPMMNRLLDALPPEAVLLLVGDPDQLPSVEAGALLGDLLEGAVRGARGKNVNRPLAGSVVRLTRVFRSNTAILDAASAVRDGDMAALKDAWTEDGVRLHIPPDHESTAQYIAGEYRHAVLAAGNAVAAGGEIPANIQKVFALYAERAVLTPLRKGPWGVPALNDRVSMLLGRSVSPFVGMPVLVSRNDPVRKLWNGDRGLILSSDGHLRVFFPGDGGFRDFPLAALPGWEPAWVQTIHKSQGSEFDRVTVLLPRGADRLLTREILYTAFTRARSRVDLFAEEETVESTLTRKTVRHSRICGWAEGN